MVDPDFLHKTFVNWLKDSRLINCDEILDAFFAFPRHRFLPDTPYNEVYQNKSVVTKRMGRGSVSSATKPGVVAVMLEQLDLERGHRVLEIGTGTGYNCALISHIVGPNGHVVSVDIDPQVVERARKNLAQFALENLRLICSDGWHGIPTEIPYDRIICTVGLNDIPGFWINQLADDGVFLFPLWIRNGVQRTIAFRRSGDVLASESIKKCDFMRLRGPKAGLEGYVFLDDSSTLLVGVENKTEANTVSDLWRLLQTSYAEWDLSVDAALSGQCLEDLLLYTCLTGGNGVTITDYAGSDSFFVSSAIGLYLQNRQSLFLIKYDKYQSKVSRLYGPQDAYLEFCEFLDDWRSLGSPGDNDFRVTISPGTPPVRDACTSLFSITIHKSGCTVFFDVL